jgi:hypothetical protein
VSIRVRPWLKLLFFNPGNRQFFNPGNPGSETIFLHFPIFSSKNKISAASV